MADQTQLEADFPVGSEVTQDEYGDAIFRVGGYWRGGLRLEEPTHGTTHVAAAGHVRRVEPRTVLVHLNVELPRLSTGTADDLEREVRGLLDIGRDDAANCPTLAGATDVAIPLAEEVS